MATFSKTNAQTLLALQSVAASTILVGAAVDVSAKMGGLIYVRFARRAATAAGAGVNIRLEASQSASANNSWFPFAMFTTAFAAVNATTLDAEAASGQAVIPLTATTGFAAQGIGFCDNATIANSEWFRVLSVSAAVSVTAEENLVNTQANGTAATAGAEIYSPVNIPEGALRIRAVADGSLFTQAFAIQVLYSTIDGIA
jgi:hypothetical protein